MLLDMADMNIGVEWPRRWRYTRYEIHLSWPFSMPDPIKTYVCVCVCSCTRCVFFILINYAKAFYRRLSRIHANDHVLFFILRIDFISPAHFRLFLLSGVIGGKLIISFVSERTNERYECSMNSLTHFISWRTSDWERR